MSSSSARSHCSNVHELQTRCLSPAPVVTYTLTILAVTRPLLLSLCVEQFVK